MAFIMTVADPMEAGSRERDQSVKDWCPSAPVNPDLSGIHGSVPSRFKVTVRDSFELHAATPSSSLYGNIPRQGPVMLSSSCYSSRGGSNCAARKCKSRGY